MRLLRRTAGALALVLALGACSPGGGTDGADGAGGDDAFAARSGGRLPDVELAPFDDGEPLELRALRGPAVINLWASWCIPCREELPRYQEFAEAHGSQVAVVGIDSEETSEERARRLVEDSGVSYPNYLDPDDALRAIALPKVVLVDEAGEIAFEQYVEIDSVGQLEDLVREHLGVAL